MKLIALIDGNGNCFVGKFGRDESWVFEDNVEPSETVYNESGYLDVDTADIDFARSKHPIQNGAIYFADEDVQEFFNGKQPDNPNEGAICFSCGGIMSDSPSGVILECECGYWCYSSS